MKKKLIILTIAVVALVLSFKLLPRPCADCQARVAEVPSGPYVMVGSTPIPVEIADTQEERQRGLSGREALAEGSGLLFVFENVGRHGIWMKDMKFPIDIIWADEEGKIVDIEERVSPDTYPKVFHPSQPAKYVLEVPAGLSEASDFELGQTLSIGQ